MEEKRKTLVLVSKNMPEHIYKLLEHKSSTRSLTPFVVDLVERSHLVSRLEQRLDRMESMLSRLLEQGITLSRNAPEELAATMYDIDRELLEGNKVLEFEEVVGSIDAADLEDVDY